MTEDKKLKVVFAPGCFDDLDGDQAELDELIAEINRLVESGEIFEKAQPVDFDDGTWDEEEIERVVNSMDLDDNSDKRTLN
jgi:hypothetical protein